MPVYAPRHHRDVIEFIYRNLGAADVEVASTGSERTRAESNPGVRVEVLAAMR
jgi:hypothetical protein